MIISRTPFRISLFGGGTDYPVWFKENGGAVLATSINKYSYITCRHLPPFFEHKSRIVWSLIERVKNISEVLHPSVRETLKFLQIKEGVEIHHDGDLPARSGLGSSSSFTVGLLHALYALKGAMPSKKRLSLDAIHIEQGRLRENVGSQDQVLAAFGGFNRVVFHADGDFEVYPMVLPKDRIQLFEKHFMLFFTGLSRIASEICGAQIKATPQKRRELHEMHQMVEQAVDLLQENKRLEEFGKLLHENWRLKRSLTRRISTKEIDEIYEIAQRAGALGGKLLGAGGGGFILFFVRPDQQQRVRQALRKLLCVPFRFESLGSQIIFYQPDDIHEWCEIPSEEGIGERPARAFIG